MKPEVSTAAVLAAVVAFGSWGVLPVYWKQLSHLGSDLALAHRVVWTLVVLVPVLLARGEWREWLASLRQPGVIKAHTWSGLLLGINWGVFIWSAHHGRIVECSLGYFLNPLLNVLIGRLFLGEQLSRAQGVSVALAAIGFGNGKTRPPLVPMDDMNREKLLVELHRWFPDARRLALAALADRI